MERELNPQRHAGPGGGLPPEGGDLDAVRGKLQGMLHAADKILDSIQPVAAEDYLQQSRQRGAE